MKYGALPDDLGLIDITPTEMMFWMYLPISVPGMYGYRLPPNLNQFEPILRGVWKDQRPWVRFMTKSYIYITAKTLWVGCNGKNMNRPGWHSDGFGTDDLNYIWSDRAPTEFLHLDPMLVLSDDCNESMRQMAALAYEAEALGPLDFAHKTFPDKHLLRLDEAVIHRAAENVTPGMRTFVKVSISENRYDLLGNSINHELPASHWPLVARAETRNHPSSENK